MLKKLFFFSRIKMQQNSNNSIQTTIDDPNTIENTRRELTGVISKIGSLKRELQNYYDDDGICNS